MKTARILTLFLLTVLLTALVIPADALEVYHADSPGAGYAENAGDGGYGLQPMRAGGGSSGGGSSGGGGGSSSSGGYTGSHSSRSGRDSVGMTIVKLLLLPLVLGGSVIAFRLRILRYGRNTKKLLRMLARKDSAWKYKPLLKKVHETYHLVQKCWTKMDMSPAASRMSRPLLSEFKTKLSWMKYRGQQNVLKKIRLLDAVPVAVHDDPDDCFDHVWFYIHGSMVDYTIDTATKQITDGRTVPGKFVEYWRFLREESGAWVLNKILQEDEADAIQFTE